VNVILMRGVKPVRRHSLVDPARLRRRIAQARERGYALLTNEAVMNDISVGASITDEHGRPVAGIAISVPTTRWTLERAEAELVPHVQLTATSLSAIKFTTN
jgi:IclR family pca regulon transcriptional regulator